MSQTRISSSTGEVLKRKYIYLPMNHWYKLQDLVNLLDKSEHEVLQELINRVHKGLLKGVNDERTEVLQTGCKSDVDKQCECDCWKRVDFRLTS